MAEPTPPPPMVVANPLQWQVVEGQADNGTKVVVLIFNQGLINLQVVLSLPDADQVSQGLATVAARARTGLIIPTGPLPKLNGGTG